MGPTKDVCYKRRTATMPNGTTPMIAVQRQGMYQVCSWNRTLARCWTRTRALATAEKHSVLTCDTVWVFRNGNTKSIAIFHVTSDKAQGV